MPAVSGVTGKPNPDLNLTPTGAAGGGTAPVALRPNQTLMAAGLIVLAAGASWGFYYFVKPQHD